MFKSVRPGPPDPMYDLKVKADSDHSPTKADLGVGIYRNEIGHYQELDCVRQAKAELAKHDPGHDYEVTTGNAQFLDHASRLMLGEDCPRLLSHQVASVQTISGTGAVHTAALLIAQCLDPLPAVYVGVPAWGNYKPLCELVGLDVVEYPYYNSARRTVDFDSVLRQVQRAPSRSVFVLQGCCHNPTGADLTPSQWDQLAVAMKERDHFPLFDVAYQGLGNGLDEDVYGVRLFARSGFDMFICQSFSKNFALYGERCGALHALCSDSETAYNIHDRLRCLIRWEFSSSPAFGSRLVNIVMGSTSLSSEWRQELVQMQERIKSLRQQLYFLLTDTLKTPGDWSHITLETGLFSYLRLTPIQCRTLVENHHIYLPPNGRINVSGLSKSSVERVASAIDQVIRASDEDVLSAKLA